MKRFAMLSLGWALGLAGAAAGQGQAAAAMGLPDMPLHDPFILAYAQTLHRPFQRARGKLYERRDEGDRLTVVRERRDLDGDAAQR